MRIRKLCFAVASSLLAGLGGCSGTHTAAEPQPLLRDEADPAGWYCSGGSRSTVGDDEVVAELGFAPADVLAFAIGHHEATLRWSDDGDLDVSPERDSSTLNLEVERAGDVVLFKPDNAYTGHGSTCELWYEIPVRLALNSEGGALDEAFSATLRTRRPDAAFLRVTSEGGELDGALEALLSFQGMELEPEELLLSVGFSRTSASGVLEGRWQLPPSEEYVPDRKTLALWGPADCGRLQLAVDFTASRYGRLARSMVNVLRDLAGVRVTWSDGSSTAARTAFTTDADGACFTPIYDPSATWAHTQLDGFLELQTDDGRLDGSYEVTAAISGDSTLALAGHTIRVAMETNASEGPMAPSELGFVRITTADVPRPSMSLTLTVNGDRTLDTDSEIILWSNELVCEPDPELCTDEFEAAERGVFSLSTSCPDTAAYCDNFCISPIEVHCCRPNDTCGCRMSAGGQCS
jgi:hypothetical protein